MSAPRLFTARTRDEMRNIADEEILGHWLNQPVLMFEAAHQAWAATFEEGLNELRDAHRKGRDEFRVYGGKVRDLKTEARYRWRRLVDKSIGVHHAGKAPRLWERPFRWSDERAWRQWELDEQRERAGLEAEDDPGFRVVSNEVPFWELLCLKE